MRISDAFPSKYLRADDLKGRRVPATISHVNMEEVGTDEKPESKPVVFFRESKKGLVMNKTNAAQIAYMYGDDTESWVGKKVELFTTMVSFQGGTVLAIRIAPPPGQAIPTQTLPDGREVLEQPPRQIDDDPFGLPPDGGDPRF